MMKLKQQFIIRLPLNSTLIKAVGEKILVLKTKQSIVSRGLPTDCVFDWVDKYELL